MDEWEEGLAGAVGSEAGARLLSFVFLGPDELGHSSATHGGELKRVQEEGELHQKPKQPSLAHPSCQRGLLCPQSKTPLSLLEESLALALALAPLGLDRVTSRDTLADVSSSELLSQGPPLAAPHTPPRTPVQGTALHLPCGKGSGKHHAETHSLYAVTQSEPTLCVIRGSEARADFYM